ncbi:hypothetical protein EF909_27015 [Streptomyces sp. WAC01280]|nr:hypothetical protein EF909_27015 [Streptomyces sp. WAC01280]
MARARDLGGRGHVLTEAQRAQTAPGEVVTVPEQRWYAVILLEPWRGWRRSSQPGALTSWMRSATPLLRGGASGGRRRTRPRACRTGTTPLSPAMRRDGPCDQTLPAPMGGRNSDATRNPAHARSDGPRPTRGGVRRWARNNDEQADDAKGADMRRIDRTEPAAHRRRCGTHRTEHGGRTSVRTLA